MPIAPETLWQHLSPQCRRAILDELTAIVQEILHEPRPDHRPPSDAPGRHLHPSVQSSTQVLTNQESLRLQYALKTRALELGWRESDIHIIDSDLGESAASAQHREGFKELLSQLTLDQVGIILSVDVTRLSRNCSDWHPLLDLCGYKDCLIADRDGIYDPRTPNGRLLLGLKGQISEMELHTLRLRLTTGLPNQGRARRIGPDTAGRLGARAPRYRGQGPQPRDPGPHHAGLSHLPRAALRRPDGAHPA
jgi:resolvase-like protein